MTQPHTHYKDLKKCSRRGLRGKQRGQIGAQHAWRKPGKLRDDRQLIVVNLSDAFFPSENSHSRYANLLAKIALRKAWRLTFAELTKFGYFCHGQLVTAAVTKCKSFL